MTPQSSTEGTVTLAPAPPGRVEVLLPGDGGARLGEVAAGPAAATVTLRLPH